MRTTIDGAGRIVVPKALREAMRFTAGQTVEIGYVDGRLEITVPPTPVHLVDAGDGVHAVADRPMPVLSSDMVRDVLEETRR
jgi:AbrB family looped-hinge helix DNA binding protein